MLNKLQELIESGGLEKQARQAVEEGSKKVSAEKVLFNAQTNETSVTLTDGDTFSFPTREIQGLRHASLDTLKGVTLLGAGTLLSWDDDEVVLTVEGLFCGRYGTEKFMERQLLSEVSNLSEAEAKEQFSFLDTPVNDNDSIKYPLGLAVAARATADFAYQDRLRILKSVEASFLGVTKSEEFRQLAGECIKEIQEERVHYLQGEKAAKIVYDYAGKTTQDFDVVSLVKKLKIKLKEEFFNIDGFRGLSVWGKKYGPGILINLQGQKGDWDTLGWDDPVTRVTLAHELGHSLLDPLDLADRAFAESRAIAFAGELLLPTAIAFKEWETAGRPEEENRLQQLIRSLQLKYKVPARPASWKLEHGAKEVGINLQPALNRLFPKGR